MSFTNRKFKRMTSMFMAALLLLSTFLPSGLIGKAHAEQADHIVISQVFGGGGNSGAPFNKDFIELYNPTDQPVNLKDWSVQYASSAGTSWQFTALDGVIPANGYYLITEAGGANGVDLPTADASGSIAMAAGAGKVVLLKTTTSPTDGKVPANAVDFVGFGAAANAYEGTGPTKTLDAKTSAQRRPYANVDPATGKGNAWDTDDNAADFYVGLVAAPRNTASTPEKPMVPITSLQVKGTNIQFTQNSNDLKVVGQANAAEPGSTIKVYENASKGTALATATAAADGSFSMDFTSDKTLPSVFVTAKQGDLDESAAIQISVAAPSAVVAQDKLSYSISNGTGTLIGSAATAAAGATVNVYPNDKANASERLATVTAGTAGDFTTTFKNAPDTVYVTQITTSSKGIMLESASVSVTKADTTTISQIADVRKSDDKGQAVNLNKFFTVEGVATVDTQILGTQKQNYYIQDGTAGINIFGGLDTPFKTVKGDKVRVTGKVLQYNGLVELEATAIEKISYGNPVPAPKTLTIMDLNTYATAEPLEGSLVSVTGKVSAVASTPPNWNVTLVDENNKATTLRVMATTGINPDNDLVTGKSYTVTGVLGQYTTNASATNGYQLYPRDPKDISPILAITHTAIKEVYKGTSVEFAANADGAETVTAYYRATGATEFIALPMVKGSEGRYTVTLPAANVPQNGFEYYIEAKAGTQVQSAGTSATPYAVKIIADTFGPTISGETPQDGTKVESPTPEISALIDDPSGVDETTVQLWLDGQELKAPAATISKTQVKYTPAADLALGKHTVKVAAKDVLGNASEKEWTFEVVPRFTGGNHYRGTTHNHTSISHDAAGSPEDALKAGKAHHYDWFAFSDHSHDIDPEKLGVDTVEHGGMQERTGGDQWQLTKDLAKQYTKNNDYVVFPAFEMTSTTWGHSNIFGTDNFIDRNINGKQYQDLNKYYAWVMTYDDIVGQFNHPDMSANAFNNFKPYNKDLDKLFTMLEVGNGSGHYGYANAEGKFFSALDLGWHVAPTYGEDNHDGTWGQTNARTVIVADDLSQDSLMHAMRNMRVYMAEDPNFTLDVLANGYYMGSTVDSKKLNFKITGSDPVAEKRNSTDYNYLPTSYKSDDRVKLVELVSNSGKVVASTSPMTADFEWNPEYTVTGGQQWFVVRVTQMDGERIYSAPIWSKEESVDVKVNGIDIDGGVIIGGNPAKLTATVANNGKEAIKNLKVDFYYDEVKQENFIGTNNISSILSKGSAGATATWPSPLKGDHQLIVVVTSTDGLDIGDVKYTMPVKIKEPLGVTVLIDAAHGNENTSADSGSYKDNLKAFTLMLQKEGYTVTENKVALTDEVLTNVKVLVLTHARTALTAAERAAVTKFINNGGSLLMAGKSNNGTTDPTINNPLLTDIGTQIRMGNDGVFDDSKTGNFWGDPAVSPYAVRLHPGLVSNYMTDRVSFVDYYSGTSLSGPNNTALTEGGKVTILAKGNETTYQGNIKGGYTYDAVSDETGGSAIPLIASEEIGANGRIVVSGMNIFNDKQMDESFEPKGNDEMTINAVNWLAHRETKVMKIADARKLADDTNVVVEGTVTTGAGVFFDAFYLQDDTNGIMAYLEVPDGSLKAGDKVRVYGHIKTYETNIELEFTSFTKDVIKLGKGTPVQPKQVATGEATSAANQGLLVKVKGTVVSKYDENSYVINDGSGDVIVFTDGYIVNQSGVSVPDLKKGDTLEAVGLSGAFSQGTRIRVRDTRELVGTIAPDTTAPVVTGVENNGIYNKDVVITFDEGTATLNGKDFTNGTVVSEEGSYTLVVIDEAGNKTTVSFTIDKTAPEVSGVEDGFYNHEVTITFNDGTATLNSEAFKSGTTVSEEGTYTLVVTDKAGNSTVVNFTIDKTAPSVTGVADKSYYNHDVTITFDKGTATLNGNEFKAETVVSDEGSYTLVVTDKAGNVTTVKFTIDKTAPVVSGVENNGLYNHDVTVSFNELGGLLDGNPVPSGTIVSEDGTHLLVVTDLAGNVTTVVFSIDKTAPVVTGVKNNGLYNKDVTVSFNEGTATLNGKAVKTGTVVKTNGVYTVVVTDAAGNKTTVKFTIDKTAPVVTGVSNNGLYNKDVKVSFNEGTATLNGKAVKTGTVVKTNGVYTVVVSDAAGNKTTVKFTIDKTAPVVTGVSNNGLYNKDVKVSFNEGTATLNGKAVKTGTEVKTNGIYTVVVTDAAGNKTTVKFTIDKTAPTAAKINQVSDKSTKVTGKAEANATVKLYIAGKYQRSVTADKSGNYSFTIKTQKAGTEIKVTATDKAGNVSKATTVKVVDKTAPSTPKVDKVTVKSTKVTGKAEAGSKVVVKVGSKVIGKATADKKGNFSAKIAKQKAGKTLSVTATDKAGNVSNAKKVTIVK